MAGGPAPSGWGNGAGGDGSGGGDPGSGLIPTFNTNYDPTGAPPGDSAFMPPPGGDMQPMPPGSYGDGGLNNAGDVMTDAMAGNAGANIPPMDIPGGGMPADGSGGVPDQGDHPGMPSPNADPSDIV